ncbi:ribokinase [Christensenella tenuis]|jgi:ribokinase|uniref:Ribokinase n=1 Tax=Christensenella tenuis TaxID=2763033 RepID=A0ABR7EFR8_9FIRM|nr:ribokinase [Christensenella tenuis]MBC5648231.1 ribokinase [Christensenella tenuis]
MKKKIVMFGSYVADLTGTADHLPRAGETVFGERFKIGPGGKGSNQAVAAHRAGADIVLATKLGKDVFGDLARDFYAQERIAAEYVLTDDEKGTGIALICVDEVSKQNQILVVPGACMNFTDADIETLRPAIEAADILLVQFEVNMDALEKAVDIARAAGVTIVLNPAPARKVSREFICKADVVTPNEVEAAALTGIPVENASDAQKAADIFHSWGIPKVVITLGKQGVFASAADEHRMVPARIVEAVDTTGAGDAFNGGFVTALSEGKDLFEAVEFGNALASLAVQKFGTAPSMPMRGEIDKIL